jgi:hypothetical protein
MSSATIRHEEPLSINSNYSRKNHQFQGEVLLENSQNTPILKALEFTNF